MSIENGVTAAAPKTAAQAAGGHGPGKAQAGTAAPGGFASVLMGLGADEPQPDAGKGEPLAERRAPEAATVAADATAPVADAGLAAAAVAQVQIRVPADSSPEAGQAAHGRGRALAGVRPGMVRADAQPAGQVGEKETRSAPVPDLPAEAKGQQGSSDEVQPFLRQVALAQRMAQKMQASDAAAQDQRLQRVEAAAARLQAPVTEHLVPDSSQALQLAAAAGDAGLRPAERRQEKNGPRTEGVGDAGAWSGSLQAEGPRIEVPAVAADPGQMTEMHVAEQVSYWIGRGVQNAEMKLDGLGEGPVKVSIALQGQEARVEFRADQAQTRQVLEDSMPHLRELLAREGLTLSGMSVGTSGSDGAAGRQPQGRPGSRQAVVAVPEPSVSAGGAPGRAATLTGRSVDLFV